MKERSLAQVDGDHGSINANVFFADEIDAPVAGFNTSTPNSHEPNISAIGKCHVTQMCLGLIVNDHVIGNGHVIGKEHVQISQTFAHTHRPHIGFTLVELSLMRALMWPYTSRSSGRN